MVTTHNGNANTSSQDRGNGGEQENPIPPLPPPPAEGPNRHLMMANQAQLINLFAQSINNTQNLHAAGDQPQAHIPPPLWAVATSS